MPKVHKLKAAKDYPEIGVKKGEHYFKWSLKRQRGGITRKSKTYPKPQQLTENPFYIACYDISDAIDAATDIDGLRAVKDDIDALRDETQEKLDNMPEGLQQGSTGELLQERIENLESWGTELESACDEAENADADDDDCEHCDGTGKVEDEPGVVEECSECGGTGKNEGSGEEKVEEAFNEAKETASGANPF
jgi:hypothetical protein